MKFFLDIKTPAQDIAMERASDFRLKDQGFSKLNRVYWNLNVSPLYEEAIFRREGTLGYMGPFIVNTGKHTARSATDKFVVREVSSEGHVWWGQYNRPFAPPSCIAL